MNLKTWHIAGAIFTIIAGTLDHFVYEWSGENPLIAPFAAVNESVWEHLKLLIIPMLFFSILEHFAYGNRIPGFVPVKVFAVISGAIFILAIFYGYTALAGHNWLWADISTFIIAVLAAWFLSYFGLKKQRFPSISAEIIARVVAAALIVCLIFFTIQPPQISLFQDPITGQFGL